ncbi:MAG: AAA family ATPase [Lachnospiraceae bacterium]|nr:AAA family ATPase [Lachnospiraceae bacterium]
MLERQVYTKLKSWKDEKPKRALCVIGARQIGKTTIIELFGREHYENFVEINFVTDTDAHKIFAGNLDADTIIENLTAFKMQKMEPGKTLVFLDEIQECPNARSAIKFLVEDGRFDYIESGSMLGVRYHEVRSYPVGFEEIYYMYPMSFEEYAYANGVQESTISRLRHCYVKREPVPDAIHTTILKLFYTYIVVGGMPAAVQTYADSHDIGRVVQVQRDILELYRLDIAKYATGSERIKIQAIFDSIPSQLNDKNRRFFLSKIDENGRYNRYENSFLWLSDAGVALPSYNVAQPQAPLQMNEKRNVFRLFLNDTGLLCAACMTNIQFALLNGDMEVNMGSILKNVFAQSIRSGGFSLHYYESKKMGEVDFVVQNGMKTDLIEVKSGSDYKKHPALNHMSEVENWIFGKKIVFCKGNTEEENGIEYLPWYMVMFYQREAEPLGYINQVDLSKLREEEYETKQ